MAVQAQYPSNILPDLRNRTTQILGVDSRNFLSPMSIGTALSEDCQLQPGDNGVSNQLRLFHSVAARIPGQTNVEVFHQTEPQVVGSRKRVREADLLTAQRQQHTTLSLGEFHQARSSPLGVPSSGGIISTGLRLAFDGERLNSSSTPANARIEPGSAVLSSVYENVTAQLQQQREELDQFLKTQEDQFRNALEDRREKHSRALLASIEEVVTRKLRDRELELEKANRRNRELDDRVKHLSLEAHMWQTRAKSNEAMMAALRTNLQHAVAQSREQSREGCGDSEADDAASAHVDENAEAQARACRSSQAWRLSKRACRICMTNEVSILVLPCRHLCLCKDCEGPLERCPLCHSLKSASVEVYMS